MLIVSPTTLQIVESGDGIAEITAFMNEMSQYPFVRWATIEEAPPRHGWTWGAWQAELR